MYKAILDDIENVIVLSCDVLRFYEHTYGLTENFFPQILLLDPGGGRGRDNGSSDKFEKVFIIFTITIFLCMEKVKKVGQT